MAQKSERQAAILALIGENDVASQENLRQLLARRGVSVTQATLSRDLRELGVVRVPAKMDHGTRSPAASEAARFPLWERSSRSCSPASTVSVS